MEKIITWNEVYTKINQCILKKHYDYILGISRGGIVVSTLLSKVFGIESKVIDPFSNVDEFKDKEVLIADDIEDTGATIKYFKKVLPKADFFTLVKKKDSSIWYIFPWETKEDTTGGIEKACVALLRAVKENPMREGLLETPKRFAKAWQFWCSGYDKNPKDIMKVFDNPGMDQLVIVPKIEYYSLCEHHLAPFYGQVSIGYLPRKKVLGVSKFARLVDIYSRRLQIQENMTQQIADDVNKYLHPLGVAVVVKGIHLCMRSRGVEKQNAEVITSVMLGKFRKNSVKEEFLDLIK